MYKNQFNYFLLVKLVVLILLISGCSQNRMKFYENTPSTDLSKENVGAIMIGSNESDVRSNFGEPDSIHKSKEPDAYYLIYGEDENLQFKIVNGLVTEYFFADKKLKTEKSISIGSSKEEVVERYGENYYTRTDTGEKNNVLGYFDKENNIALEFIFDKDLIVVLLTQKNRPISTNAG